MSLRKKKCYTLLSFKSSLLPKVIAVSVELCWQIISHPAGGSLNILSVLTRTIILAGSCLCMDFISLRSGWMSLQGPLLRAKCGWVKSDIINSYFCMWSLRRVFVLRFRFWMVIFWRCIFKDCGWEILSSHKNHSFCLNLPSALLFHILHHWPCRAWFSFVHWL